MITEQRIIDEFVTWASTWTCPNCGEGVNFIGAYMIRCKGCKIYYELVKRASTHNGVEFYLVDFSNIDIDIACIGKWVF